MSHAGDGAHPDVLIEELRGGEVCEHLSVVDTGALLVALLLDLLKLGLDALVDRVKHRDEVKWLLLEVLILSQSAQLHESALGPVRDLVVNNIDFLETLLELALVAADIGEVLIHLHDFLVVGVHLGSVTIVVAALDLQLLHLGHELFILLLEIVDLGLAGGDSLQKGGVGLFFLLEATDHGLHISDAGVRLDLLKRIIDAARGLHLLVHLALHEVVPKLVDVQVVAHLELGGVLAFIGSSFSNLLILLLPLDTALD